MNLSTISPACAAALLAVCICAPAAAGSTSATFQASLTIVSSCAVAATPSAPSAPIVSCSHAEPYRLDLAPQQARQNGVWTVTF